MNVAEVRDENRKERVKMTDNKCYALEKEAKSYSKMHKCNPEATQREIMLEQCCGYCSLW